MANTKTQLNRIPIIYPGSTDVFVYPVVITFDTTGADLSIFSPDDNKHCALVGLQYSAASAHTLTIKSGSTTLLTYQFPDNAGFSHPIGDPILMTNEGEDLVFNVGTAAVPSMLAYVASLEQISN